MALHTRFVLHEEILTSEDDVIQLEVAVVTLACVHVMHGAGELPEDAAGMGLGKWPHFRFH